jgi:hypothetical protein
MIVSLGVQRLALTRGARSSFLSTAASAAVFGVLGAAMDHDNHAAKPASWVDNAEAGALFLGVSCGVGVLALRGRKNLSPQLTAAFAKHSVGGLMLQDAVIGGALGFGGGALFHAIDAPGAPPVATRSR